MGKVTKEEMLNFLNHLITVSDVDVVDGILAAIEKHAPDDPEVWKPSLSDWDNRAILLADIIGPMAMIAFRARQLDPEWKADWEDHNQEKWSVYYNHRTENWVLWHSQHIQYPGTAYMSRSTAEQIYEELNSGYLQVGIGGE